MAQTKETKPKTYTLRGKVEIINEVAKTVRVSQEAIPGYSEARKATYDVDDPAIIGKLDVGDEIVATIHEDDHTLYDIRVVRIDDRIYPRERGK